MEQGGDVRFLQGNSTAVCISGQFPMVQTQVLCGDLMELPTQTHHLAAGEEPVSAGHDDMDVFRQTVGQDTEEVHDAPIGHQVEVVDKEVVCDGTGQISLDIQFLPDVDVPCPECNGSRYSKEAELVKFADPNGKEVSLPQLMAMDVQTALQACHDMKSVRQRLTVLENLGLGYLTLGEETPSLSGGEAQRLKLAGEMGKGQSDTVFIFDEPTIGLHPLDVRTLLKVFQTLIESGATVIVIEHDLDVIRSADYIIDMGPGGGEAGGIIVAAGTPEQVAANKNSITGKYLCK